MDPHTAQRDEKSRDDQPEACDLSYRVNSIRVIPELVPV